MNREELKALGLSDEQIDSIMAAHGKVVNATKDELTSAQSELESYKTQLTDRDTQLEELRTKAQGNEDLQATIDALKQANDDAKAAHKAELSNTKLNYELDQALLLNKARNPRAVKALLDMDIVKLGDDGKVAGLFEQIETLKESDSYLFETSDTTQLNNPRHTPGAKQQHNDPQKPDGYEVGKQMYEQLKANKRI